MSSMREAIRLTIQHEGGFVDNREDHGGATKYGITQHDCDLYLGGADVAGISEEQAETVYAQKWWKEPYLDIVEQSICDKLFDMTVVLGISTGVRMLQRALGIEQDGDFGPQTLAAVNEAGVDVLPTYKEKLSAHFRWIVAQDPTQQEFLDGWLNRVNS